MTITLWCPCGSASVNVPVSGFLVALQECTRCDEVPRPLPASGEVMRTSRAAASVERKGDDPRL